MKKNTCESKCFFYDGIRLNRSRNARENDFPRRRANAKKIFYPYLLASVLQNIK